MGIDHLGMAVGNSWLFEEISQEIVFGEAGFLEITTVRNYPMYFFNGHLQRRVWVKGSVRMLYDITLHTLNSMREFFVLLDSLPYLRGDETHGPNIR